MNRDYNKMRFRYWDEHDRKYVYFTFDDLFYNRLTVDNGITIAPEITQATGYRDAIGRELWFGDSVEIYYGHRLDRREIINNIEDLTYLVRKIDDLGATFEVIKRES